MIIDIGGGTTEIAIISLGGIVFSKSIRVGGNEFDKSIISNLRRNENIQIGEITAEQLKMNIGSGIGARPQTGIFQKTLGKRSEVIRKLSGSFPGSSPGRCPRSSPGSSPGALRSLQSEPDQSWKEI